MPASGSISARGCALALCAALAASTGSAASQAAPDSTLKKEVLANDIYLFRAPSALDKWTATNVVVIVNDQDVTVFDSNTRPVTARMVIAEIRKITPKPVRTLINSHWHMDHWSGNDEYVKAFPGIQIIATTQTRDFMKRMRPRYYASPLTADATRRRTALDSAVRTGRLPDGKALTAAERKRQESDIKETSDFAAEVLAVPRVLPTLAYRDTLIIWSGQREFRLISVTGDATASTVLYLPTEKMLVMGDALVGPEDGDGPPPWTTTNYSITPWLASLRGLAALDANLIVPGQGHIFHDKAFLQLTADIFASIISQVHSGMERGLLTLPELQAAVNVDSLGQRYTPGAAAPDEHFHPWVAALVKKVQQESFDGVAKP
jgi:glyoxylase-like metal-dependent hydrolase (beta-lactamase superfamily II)